MHQSIWCVPHTGSGKPGTLLTVYEVLVLVPVISCSNTITDITGCSITYVPYPFSIQFNHCQMLPSLLLLYLPGIIINRGVILHTFPYSIICKDNLYRYNSCQYSCLSGLTKKANFHPRTKSPYSTTQQHSYSCILPSYCGLRQKPNHSSGPWEYITWTTPLLTLHLHLPSPTLINSSPCNSTLSPPLLLLPPPPSAFTILTSAG